MDSKRNSANGGDSEEGFRELRDLLAGDQISRIEKIETSIEDPKEDLRRVSRVLPEAFVLRNREDDKLSQAMAPSIEETIKESVHKRPQVLADALFPVMGPAIRRSISDTLAGFLETINQTLEHSFSPKSLKWRIEAWRTGRPFAEIILSHTILYRVEQVFLIHSETGLLLEHTALPTIDVQDGDMVSGMLTAIQDFVKDSFGVTDERDSIRSMRVGDLTVWIESGPMAAIALVLRGTPLETLRDNLKSVLEDIHFQEHTALQSFQGDASAFAATKSALDSLLVQKGKDESKTPKGKKKRKVPWLALSLLGVLALALAVWGLIAFDRSRRWSIFLDQVKSEPGYVISGEERKDGRFYLRGLRDDLAADPRGMFEEVGLDPDLLTLELAAYESLEPQFIFGRAAIVLDPPAGVSLELEGSTLVGTGLASRIWIERASRVGPFLTGITEFDSSHLRSIGQEARKSFALFLKYLEEAPGLVVVEASEDPARDGKFRVLGLRDPLATDPSELRAEAGLQRSNVELVFSPVLSLDPEILLRRAKSVLQPPAGVILKVEGQKLIIKGRAPANWAAGLEAAVGRIAGIEVVDRAGLEIAQAAPPPNPRESERSTAWIRFIEALKREPGLEFADAQWLDGRAKFWGRRDPLARSLFEIGLSVGVPLDRADLEFEPFVSDHPDIVLRRAQLELNPPVGVQLDIEGRTLLVSGHASEDWREALPGKCVGIAGLNSVDAERLFDNSVAELQGLLGKTTRLSVSFSANSAQVSESQRAAIRDAATEFGALMLLAFDHDVDIEIVAFGRADREVFHVSTRPQLSGLALRRAEAVVAEMTGMDASLGRRLKARAAHRSATLTDFGSVVKFEARLMR